MKKIECGGCGVTAPEDFMWMDFEEEEYYCFDCDFTNAYINGDEHEDDE
jgi:hypothetical protein